MHHNALAAQTIYIPEVRKRSRYVVLVYQAGIANVFTTATLGLDPKDTTGQWADRKRIYQGDFRSAETLCYGMALAGAVVRTFACNMAGDIALQTWSANLDDQPFSEKFHPQVWN